MSLNINAWIRMLYLGLTFGLSLTILKIILQTMDEPIWILFCQSTFSSILLLAFALFSKSDLSALKYNFGALALLATFGVIVPNIALYASVKHISVGSMSLLLALIPFFVYIIALSTKIEKFNLLRTFGLLLGFCAMFLLILPEKNLGIGITTPWLLVGVLTPIFIAAANVFLSRARFRPLDPISIALGMNSLAAVVLAPIVFFTSSAPFIFKSAGLSLAVVSLSVITSVGFIIFVKLIKTHGPVFASQVNYLVTISGVAWGFIIFSESHSSQFWFALGLILFGLLCVRPNGKKSMI